MEKLLIKLQTSPEGELLPMSCGDRTLSAFPDTQRCSNTLCPLLLPFSFSDTSRFCTETQPSGLQTDPGEPTYYPR